MKREILTVFIALTVLISKAQSNNVTTTLDSNRLFVTAESPPEFPGGMEKLYSFLGSVVRYPDVAKENNTQGTVIIQFVVEKDGSLSNIKVVKSVSKELDDEVMRICNLCPKWQPAMVNGVIVRCMYTLPYSFRMVKDN